MNVRTKHFDTSCPWTAEEVSYVLGFSLRYVYELARDGVLPAKKVGRRWFFDPKKVLAYVGMSV